MTFRDVMRNTWCTLTNPLRRLSDEIVQAGGSPMAHYLFAVGCVPRLDRSPV